MSAGMRAILLGLGLVSASLSGALPMFEAGMSRAQDKPRERTITLNAVGRVYAEPDIATVQVGVVTEAATAAEALSRNTTDLRKVVDVLRAAAIDGKDIQTTGFHVSPRYAPARDGNAAKITGYQVSNAVNVTVRDLAGLGGVLDKVVTSGANQIGSVRFDVSKSDVLKDEARKLAMANAIRRAQLYAMAAGVELGGVLSISEEAVFTPQPRSGAMMASAGAAPIEAGSQALDVTVHVVWALK